MKVMSIIEFCRDYRISRAHFYKMVRTGHGPRLVIVGARRLISEEAADDWIRSLQQTADEASCAAHLAAGPAKLGRPSKQQQPPPVAVPRRGPGRPRKQQPVTTVTPD